MACSLRARADCQRNGNSDCRRACQLKKAQFEPQPRVCSLLVHSWLGRWTKCEKADRMTNDKTPRATASGSDSHDTISHSPTRFFPNQPSFLTIHHFAFIPKCLQIFYSNKCHHQNIAGQTNSFQLNPFPFIATLKQHIFWYLL